MRNEKWDFEKWDFDSSRWQFESLLEWVMMKNKQAKNLNFHLEIFRLFFQFTFTIQAFSSKLLLSRFRHFLPSYFQDQAFSSKILPRSDIFFQVTSKIRHFLPSYFQDQIFSCKILQDQTFSCKILQDQTLSSKIFQDTCKNNALSSKILEVKSDRFLQEMYGSSTGETQHFCSVSNE